jgi:hypothetical protein
MTKSTKTPIGPTREIRAPGYDDVARGERCCFTITPIRFAFDDDNIPHETGELRDWKGRHVACVDLD